MLGHSELEHQRLAFQAQLIAPITRKLLVDAGIQEGMSVLDVGTGRGDVALIAADLVGARGRVVGIDSSAAAIAAARARAAAEGRGNVLFEQADPAAFRPGSPLDAVVGRYVLQFLPDPAGAIRQLSGLLRHGGILAFHEIDWTGHRSCPPVPLWDRCCRLVTDAIAAGGAEIESGSRIPSIFAAAGLPAPTVELQAIVGAGTNSDAVVQRLANLTISLLPRLQEQGLLAPDELDAERLPQQLAAAVALRPSFVVAGSEVTAHVRLAEDRAGSPRA